MARLQSVFMEISSQACGTGYSDRFLDEDEARAIVSDLLCPLDLDGKRVLLIVPDSTRTAPVGQLFRLIHQTVGERVAKLDVMIALGTHQPMSDEAIRARLEIDAEQRASIYGHIEFFNHAWDDDSQLRNIGTIPREEIRELSGGLFEMDVEVEINRRVFDYDLLLILGPVFPHEVVGFSGGNKYLFPGVSGPKVLHFFHWLGVVISNPLIIGHARTPVRAVVDRAAQMVEVPRACLCMVVEKKQLAGLYGGTPEAAWERAAALSSKLHITYKPRAFHTVLSCAPAMYDELWTGGKCMYKLEPVVEDGGELIIYAPHITQVSQTHGAGIEAIGYHVRDYYLKQWERFKDMPWSVLAHSAHVKGIGEYFPHEYSSGGEMPLHESPGVEKPRIRVTLATGISEAMCRRINLGYRDPATIDIESFANREQEGVLLVRRSGEMLYRLSDSQAAGQ